MPARRFGKNEVRGWLPLTRPSRIGPPSLNRQLPIVILPRHARMTFFRFAHVHFHMACKHADQEAGPGRGARASGPLPALDDAH